MINQEMMTELSEQLKAVKLKKCKDPMRDFSSPKTAGFMSDQEISAYQEKVLLVNTERWLDILKAETFPTEYCNLALEEAELIVSLYERLYRNLDPPAIAQLPWRDHLTPDEGALVQSMEERLQKGMDKFLEKGLDYVFVKTSSRSPKDAPMAQSRFKELYREFLEAEEIEEARQQENVKIACLLRAAFVALRVRRASEVMDMVFRSERIYQDMLLALQHRNSFCENFVVREFVDIDVDMEFRGFVHHGALVALSQYNYLIHSPRLCESKEAIADRILTFYQQTLRPKLQAAKFEDDFIIDFAIGKKDNKLWVIEINPFMITTDSALFSWEKERPLLEGQSDGLQFRVTLRPRPGAASMLPQSLKSLLKETYTQS